MAKRADTGSGSAASAALYGDHGPAGHRAEWALLAVAAGYALVQALLFDWQTFYLGRDEAIYLSQVKPGTVALPMDPHRTRGLSLLAAPIGPWSDSMLVVRSWMTLLGSVGMFLAFRPWIRTLGWAAPAAAAVFVGWWVNLYFGTQLYPNFLTAVGAVGVAGHFGTYLRDERSSDLLLVAVWLGLTALVRPVDSVLVAGALWLIMLLTTRRVAVPVTLSLAAGGLVGFAPWLLEGWLRFGNHPLEHVTAAGASGGGSMPDDALEAIRRRVTVYLSNTAGPARCVSDCVREAIADGVTMPLREQIVSAGMLAAAVVGVLGSLRAGTGRAVALAAAAMVASLGYYAICDCAVNLRYLQPAFAFAALLIGAGIVTGWRLVGRWGLPARLALRVLVVLLLAGWALYQGLIAGEHFQEASLGRLRAKMLAEIVDDHAGGQPCAVATGASDRQIQFFSDCLAVSLRRLDDGFVQNRIGGSTSQFDLALLADAGYRVFALGRPGAVPDGSPVWDWEIVDVSNAVLGDYLLFRAPEDVEIKSRYLEGHTPEEAGPPR